MNTIDRSTKPLKSTENIIEQRDHVEKDSTFVKNVYKAVRAAFLAAITVAGMHGYYDMKFKKEHPILAKEGEHMMQMLHSGQMMEGELHPQGVEK